MKAAPEQDKDRRAAVHQRPRKAQGRKPGRGYQKPSIEKVEENREGDFWCD